MSYSIETLVKNLDDLRRKFDSLMEEAFEKIPLENVRLSDALKNQLELQLLWETLSKKCSTLYDICEIEADTAYSNAISAELKDSYKKTTVTEAKEFAKADANYKAFRRLLADVKELRDEARGVLSTIESRKYILNNLTNSIVAGVDGTIL